MSERRRSIDVPGNCRFQTLNFLVILGNFQDQSSLGIIHLVYARAFPKNQHFLPSDTRKYVKFFGNFSVHAK